ncbi:MAG: hypothetical protein J0M04_24780 [Verrucomicrobia bacterium]|nr:hypothetical protein [Verrucomicrobiota bacterium]
MKLETTRLNLASAIERLYDLNTGIIGVGGERHERPHKPLLLLAALDLIDEAIPCAESHNDHPTNGPCHAIAVRRRRIALCKNHHWAMDRFLIAPGPDYHWHASAVLDPRRSSGEAELLALSRKPLLLPCDQAFNPDAEGLKWRLSQLVA